MNTFLCGNCLELMGTIPNASVDMILCDLPYGMNQNSWDQIIPFEPLWEHYQRVAKPTTAMVFTATEPFASQLVMSNPKLFRYDLIWIKNKSTGFLNARKMPLRSHEKILVFYRKLPIYNPQKTSGHKPVNSYTKHTSDGTNYGKTKQGISGGGQTDRYPTSVLRFPVVNNDAPDKVHATQKPVSLFEYLIRTYTDEGMLVLDNCAGSGTTAVAALNSQRNYFCIEKDLNFYQQALQRLENYQKVFCGQMVS